MTHLDPGAQPRPDPVGPTVLEASPGRRRLIPPLTWRRLPWWAELGIILIGYFAYTRSRIAAPTKERAAYFHAQQVWDLERFLHIDIEPTLNRVTAAWGPLADFVGYYYGTLHFVLTPAILIWLWLRRPAAYPRLRSTVIITTFAALITYWTWPLAPPRFALPGAIDIGTVRNVFGAGNAHGISDMVNLYAAMPSLHCAWALWCALAVYTTTNGRWRRLVWIYPLATTLVVMATANHYLLDAVGGAAAVGLGWYLTRPVGERKPKPPPPRESIVVDSHVGDTVSREVANHDDEASEGGTIVDVRRPSAPTPPTER